MTTEMADSSAGDLVFTIPMLREAIFKYHYEATLLDIPQGEDLPDDDELLTPEDQNVYLGQLEPFLSFHGYKTTTWGDYLELNALELEDMLPFYGPDAEDLHEELGADPDTTVDTPLRMLGRSRESLYLFDFGLFKKTMVDLVLRPAEPDQIFSVYFMPRGSAAGKCWIALGEELARGKRPRGLLPVEDVLLYGEDSVLLVAHFRMTHTTRPWNIRHALEQLTSAFEGLSSVHSKGISINFWPHIGAETDRAVEETSFINSYAFWADDPAIQEDWLSPGSKAPSDEPKYAPIVGRPFPRRITTRFPPEPKDGCLHLQLGVEALPGSWTPRKATQHPLVPSAPFLLWNLLWSSTDDRCDHSCATGEREQYQWEETVAVEDEDFDTLTLNERYDYDLSACHGDIQDVPWRVYVCRSLLHEVAPEEHALACDDKIWGDSPEPLPYDRFKRDVYNLAAGLFHTIDFSSDVPELEVKTQVEQLRNEKTSQYYERVFKTPFDKMDRDGPDGIYFSFRRQCGSYWAPDRVRRLFLRMLDDDPEKRPTAQEAAQELREVLAVEVPRITELYARWYAWKYPPQSQSSQDFSKDDYRKYLQRITTEEPPILLWAEEAFYRARKRQGRTSPMDALLEDQWHNRWGGAKKRARKCKEKVSREEA